MNEKTITDKIIDFLFEKKDFVFLILIVLLGAIIRAIISGNIGPNADEIVYGTHAIDIIKSGSISNQNQSILWFYLQDIFYNLFGVTLFSARFSSFLFGTLTILAVFLITKEISNNKKTAFLAAFLYALSPYACREMMMEMDTAAVFFVIFAVYFFIKDLKQNKISIPAFAIAALGYMIKALSLFFIFGFILVYIIHYFTLKDKKKEFLNKKNIRLFLISCLIMLLIVLPIITYNLLLYKEKGITDIMFARFFHVKVDIFESIMNTALPFQLFGDTGFIWGGLSGTVRGMFLNYDTLAFILFLLGIAYFIMKKNKEIIYLTIIFILPYIFTAGTSILLNHFVYYPPLFAIVAAIFLKDILEKMKWDKKEIYGAIAVIFIIYTLVLLWPHLTSTSGEGKVRDYTIKNIDENTLVIVDARIYRGEIAWMFNDKHYIEASLFQPAIDSLKNIPQKEAPIKIVFIECAIDDCGWGTIRGGELNDSMEYLVSLFSNMSKQTTTINNGGGYTLYDTNTPHFRAYETVLMLKPSILKAVDQTHVMFYYPVRWKLKDQIYDSLNPQTFGGKALYNISYLFVWLEIIASFTLVIWILIIAYKKSG